MDEMPESINPLEYLRDGTECPLQSECLALYTLNPETGWWDRVRSGRIDEIEARLTNLEKYLDQLYDVVHGVEN